MPTPRRDRRQERHEATRREILDAAWANVRARGLGELSLREVAEAMGMRTPSLYVYFPNKIAILDAMFAEAARALHERLAAVEPDGRPDSAVLLEAAESFLDFCVEEPARYQLLFERPIPSFQPSEASYAVAVEVAELSRRRLAELGAGSDEAVDVWMALITGMTSQQIANDPNGDRWRRLLPGIVDMYLSSAVVTAEPADATCLEQPARRRSSSKALGAASRRASAST
jgi:AcrR family transcriptional regulator